jgi:hypothetical protein
MFSDLRNLFLAVLEQCAYSAAQDRWLEAEILSAHQLIRDAVMQDMTKRFTNEEYEQAIGHLFAFAERRPAFVISEVARAR